MENRIKDLVNEIIYQEGALIMELCENSLLYSIRVKDLFNSKKLRYQEKILVQEENKKEYLTKREVMILFHSNNNRVKNMRFKGIPYSLINDPEELFL